MLRIVGFLEYGMALKQLDEFVRRASKEELQAADEMVGGRPEFAVFTSVRRRVQSAPSSLAPANGTSAAEGDRRSGLAWVIALARVEMGGILATFSPHPSPFEAVAPTPFDMAAFAELLLDGAQTHVWALVNDPEMKRVAKSVPDTKMLAYLRRLNLARAFLSAGGRANAKQLSPIQAQELLAQDSQLKSYRDDFSLTISTYLSAMNSRQTVSSSQKIDRSLLEACGKQLRHESRSLQTGSATSQTFGSPGSP